MDDKAREAFEAWAKTKGTPEQGWWFRQLEDGGYSAGGPDAGWETWQAALQWAASQQAAEGWRPVAYMRNVANLPGLMVQWLPGQREQLRNGDRLYAPPATQGGADEQR